MNKTDIEYLDFTWNPLAMLCDPVSEGCENCWHRRRANMLANNPKIDYLRQLAYSGTEKPFMNTSELMAPLSKRKPSKIGVQFMGDLFHRNVKISHLNSVFNIISRCWELDLGHTFLILTKRPRRMNKYIKEHRNYETAVCFYDTSNVWLGVTAENQKRVDERLPILLQIPTKVRFVSVEPMLERIDFEKIPPENSGEWCGSRSSKFLCNIYKYKYSIHWVIAGPETGPGKRPCKPEWIENLYDQCKSAGVPFFDKRKDYITREFPE